MSRYHVCIVRKANTYDELFVVIITICDENIIILLRSNHFYKKNKLLQINIFFLYWPTDSVWPNSPHKKRLELWVFGPINHSNIFKPLSDGSDHCLVWRNDQVSPWSCVVSSTLPSTKYSSWCNSERNKLCFWSFRHIRQNRISVCKYIYIYIILYLKKTTLSFYSHPTMMRRYYPSTCTFLFFKKINDDLRVMKMPHLK